jgi:hypothetical protein
MISSISMPFSWRASAAFLGMSLDAILRTPPGMVIVVSVYSAWRAVVALREDGRDLLAWMP